MRKEIMNQLAWLLNISTKLKQLSQQLLYWANELDRTVAVIKGEEVSTLDSSPSPLQIVNLGEILAKKAYDMYGWTIKPGHMCLAGVQNVLDAVGIITQRVNSAYMAEQVFDNNELFQANFTKSDIVNINYDSAPRGTIIIFDKTKTHPHGHIEIKSYGTSWISDYKQLKRTQYGGQKTPKAVYYVKKVG